LILQKQKPKKEKRVRALSFFKSKLFILLCIAIISAAISMSLVDPVFATRLLEFGISEDLTGVFFTMGSATYAISGLIIGRYAQKYDQRVLIFGGLLVLGIGPLLTGPSQFLHFPDQLYLIPIGQVMSGFGLALVLVPIIPAFLSSTEYLFLLDETANAELKDVISGIASSMLGLGTIIGPLMGGSLTEALGFRSMCDIFSSYMVVVSVLFFLFANVLYALRNIKLLKTEPLLPSKDILDTNDTSSSIIEEPLLKDKSCSV